MATIVIPTPLRKFTNQQSKVLVNGSTVKESIDNLIQDFPDLKKNLLEDNGNIRGYVNIFVGEDDIRDLQKEQTSVSEHSTISIIPAIAGGCGADDISFNKEEFARYNRHIIIPDFGLEAQKKLKASKVLIIGSGGVW